MTPRSTSDGPKHATYSYGDSSRPGVLLGFPLRQVLPVGVGVLVATFGLMSGLFVLVVVGPVVGCVLAFGRWRGAPLYEFAWPGLGLLWHRGRSHVDSGVAAGARGRATTVTSRRR